MNSICLLNYKPLLFIDFHIVQITKKCTYSLLFFGYQQTLGSRTLGKISHSWPSDYVTSMSNRPMSQFFPIFDILFIQNGEPRWLNPLLFNLFDVNNEINFSPFPYFIWCCCTKIKLIIIINFFQYYRKLGMK